MVLLVGLLFVYAGHIGFKVVSTNVKRKYLKTGDECFIYIGEHKIRGMVLKVNHEIDIWVRDRVMRFPRNQIYA